MIASDWKVPSISKAIKTGLPPSFVSKLFLLNVDFQVREGYRGKENQRIKEYIVRFI